MGLGINRPTQEEHLSKEIKMHYYINENHFIIVRGNFINLYSKNIDTFVCVGSYNKKYVELAARSIIKKMYKNKKISMTDYLSKLRRMINYLRGILEGDKYGKNK